MHDKQAGRVCPVDYQLDWQTAERCIGHDVEVLYIVGGLYGNPFALDTIEHMFRDEHSSRRLMVFNGDFHWFDRDPGVFVDIHERVMAHMGLRGNVETELARPGGDGIGCGCAYPDSVPDQTVAWSNQIMRELAATAAMALPGAQLEAMARLAATCLIDIGRTRVAITHGDENSLAGWGLAQDTLMASIASGLARRMRTMGADVLASSHTCLPVAMQFEGGEPGIRSVVNNGSAGMANFSACTDGVITRIASSRHAPPVTPLYEASLTSNIHVQALPVRFDARAWQRLFLQQWPPGTAAHASYFARICHGPDYSLEQAARAGFKLAAECSA